MSHAQPIPSAPGTPLSDRTVGEIVAGNPNLSRVFQAFEIGFCCQGSLTLREACARNDVALETMLAALEKEQEGAEAPLQNPAKLPPHELVDYIVEKHHGFLRRELPRIHAMSERVAHVHGGHTPSLVEVFKTFADLAQELIQHTQKEEQILFPAIVALETSAASRNPIDAPVRRMMEEHDQANQALAELRRLTNGYTPPTQACNTYRALFAGLADLETDLQQHIHLENNILFPTAVATAKSA